MLVLSAAEAVSPAINRTKRFLFQPFRWSTFLKLCAVGVLTEGFSGNFNSSGGHNGGSSSTPSFSPPTFESLGLTPGWIALILAIVVIAIGISIAIFYLITRLRFALFNCLVRETKEIRPGWHLYREQSWRFFLLNIVVGLIFFVVAVLALLPFALGFIHLFRSLQAGSHFNIAAILALVLPLIPIVLLLVIAAIAIDVILRDFMLPHLALENASAGAAWGAVRARIAAAKGSFFLYALLRILLPVVALIGALIVLAIPLIIVFGGLALSVAGLHAIGTNATGLAQFLLFLVQTVLILAGVATAILIALCVGGPLSICVRNYALLFYGSRYQALGDILSPSPPPPPTA